MLGGGPRTSSRNRGVGCGPWMWPTSRTSSHGGTVLYFKDGTLVLYHNRRYLDDSFSLSLGRLEGRMRQDAQVKEVMPPTISHF